MRQDAPDDSGERTAPTLTDAAAVEDIRERAKTQVAPQRIGHFVVLEQLGRGAMGVVYAAFDERLERKVALKVLTPHLSHGRKRARASARLEAEARTLAKLSHPNVVTIYEVGRLEDDSVFLAMELVPGMTLRAWQARGRRSWREIVAVYAAAGAGLAAAHRAGIVHRDVKPDNLLIGDDGRVCVVDFGIALVESPDEPGGDRREHTGGLGTPGYMAPEVVRRQPGDARSDQFGFCAALYEALYGERPFAAHAFSSPMGQEHDPIDARRSRPADVHAPWLWSVLDRGLSLAPADRFPSMDHLLAELTRDRTVVRRRLVVGALAVGLLASAAWASAFLAARPTAADPCAVPDDALAGVWDGARRKRVHAALTSTGLPFAEDAWRVFEPALERYAGRWVSAHRAACEDTHVRHVQSPELLDARMECLAERKRGLRALGDVAVQQPRLAAEHVAEMLAGLGDLEICADTRTLRLALELPREPGVLAGSSEVREHLAAGHARLAAGDLPGAEASLEQARRRVSTLDYQPALAELDYLDGRVAVARGRIADGVAHLRRAADTAVATRHDQLLVDAWLALALEAGRLYHEPRQAEDWLRHARASLARVAHAGDARAIGLEHAHGRIRAAFGEHARAAEILAQAYQQAVTRFGTDSPRAVLILHDQANSLALAGRAREAVDAYRAVLDVRRRVLGAEHPEVARTQLSLALVLIDPLVELDQAEAEITGARRIYHASYGADSLEAGQVEQALAKLAMFRGAYHDGLVAGERAVTIYRARLGESHPRLGEALMTVGVLRYMTGDIRGSLDAYRSALAMLEPALGPEHVDVGLLRSNIGEALLALGRVDEAAAEFSRALAIMRAGWGENHPELAFPLKGLGLAELERERPEAALEPLEAALALRQAGGDPHELAEIQWALARALAGAGRASERRRVLARQAQAHYRDAGAQWHERAQEIDRFLAR